MATEDNFAAANYDAPVAVYCGSVPKVKPRCRALRGGSIDSNLQLCGSRWITEEEGAISSLEGWGSKASVQDFDAGAGGDFSPLPHPALTHPQEREVSSAALETTRIKDKLKKRRMSEGLLAPQRGLTDSSDPKGVVLKPAISRSASQRLLVTSKPVPPIQNSLPTQEPGWMSNGEQELREDGTDRGSSEGNHKELISEASLQPLYCGDEEGKKSLGVALIPPIPKSVRPFDGDPGSTEMPLPSLQQLVSQESLEMRPRSGSRTEEKTSASLDLPLGQAKEMDHLLSPRLLKDDDLKDSNGRIHITISKSAQEKMRQKQTREMELLLREREKERAKEKSLQFSTWSADLGGAARDDFGQPHINGAASISSSTSNACRSSIGTMLRKRVNRPSLPSIPVISQDTSFPRHSSANSLPAIALGCLEWGEEPECGDAGETRPFSHPEQGLLDALAWLSSSDWQLKGKGLFSIRRLAICHSEILLGRLHDVTLAVTKEVNNLRSKVSRFAISTLGELFRIMKKHMDQEVEEVARALLRKTGDSSEFIQKAADRSLGIMVGSVTPARAMAALLAGGVNHRNVLVRKYAAEHLLTVMEQIGAEKLLSGSRDSVELLVHMLVKLAQDCNQDTRFYGRKMLSILMSHPKFDGHLKQFLPSRDLQVVMATIKQKGIEDRMSEPPSAKGRGESRNSGLMTSQEHLPSDEGSSSDVLLLPHQTVRRTSLRSVEEIEQLKELNKLLTAKEFQTRMEGVVLLLDHCKSNPQLISANMVQIFDVFVPRLQDSNKKVKQQSLEALASVIPILRDTLHPVLVSVIAAVTDNLNSKHTGIYTAAVKVLEASIAHLDNVLLLQALAHRVRFLSGRAMQDVTEQLSVLVASVYPWKAHVVERYALPVLWFFLSNMIGNGVLPGRSSNVRAAVTKLAKSLHREMGSSLKEHAASQPPHVAKHLWHVLDLDGQ
ncbi:TOG array regulator of axonemal microtubules protein 2 isoform X2 [Numida meleagris]|uniref:TOG array regulator of axonemal microtubules protein 2 isoform X2 n=1 Tax=Numida meleagris TaxID=8996 RepID=UPI000B3DB302|nr:TOG array regulator of axonemal microtubules protein 2 isoform X2 [Numida meleagris]